MPRDPRYRQSLESTAAGGFIREVIAGGAIAAVMSVMLREVDPLMLVDGIEIGAEFHGDTK